MTYDAWLSAPYEDALRNGEALEALEEQYLSTEEFASAFEMWQADCMDAFQPLTESPLDTYLGTGDYASKLDAYIENWFANKPDDYEDHDDY